MACLLVLPCGCENKVFRVAGIGSSRECGLIVVIVMRGFGEAGAQPLLLWRGRGTEVWVVFLLEVTTARGGGRSPPRGVLEILPAWRWSAARCSSKSSGYGNLDRKVG